MTTTTSTTSISFTTDRTFRVVAVDLYRNIHKGIRTELFAVTAGAGSIDPNDDEDVGALDAHVRSVNELLLVHAGHEDRLDGLLQEHVPDLADRIADDHDALEDRFAAIVELCAALARADGGERRSSAQLLHLDLASFTGEYLAHQDLEERQVMPALHDAIGPQELGAIQQGIMSSIPPDVMARSLAFMLPAMNIDDRAEQLGAMRAHAPAEVFDRVWGLTTTVLEPRDLGSLAFRLGVAQ